MFVPETNAGIEEAFLEGLSSDAVVVAAVAVVVGGEEGVCADATVVSVEGDSTGGGGKSTKSTPASVCGAGGRGSGGCVNGAGEGGANVDACGGVGEGGIQPSWRATPSKSARRSSGDAVVICGLTA
jgi:hypothetical protein